MSNKRELTRKLHHTHNKYNAAFKMQNVQWPGKVLTLSGGKDHTTVKTQKCIHQNNKNHSQFLVGNNFPFSLCFYVFSKSTKNMLLLQLRWYSFKYTLNSLLWLLLGNRIIEDLYFLVSFFFLHPCELSTRGKKKRQCFVFSTSFWSSSWTQLMTTFPTSLTTGLRS